MLKRYLNEGVVKVTFTKANGDKRVMNATLKQDLLPAHTGDSRVKVAVSNPETARVFDVDIKDWRSFRYDSILEMVI